MPPRKADIWLPSGPLVDRVEARGGIAALLPDRDGQASLRRAYQRAKAKGVLTVVAADPLAVKLLHVTPYDVWGADYELASRAKASGSRRDEMVS